MEFNTKRAPRKRSPNYPNYNLKECITFLEKLYKKYGENEVHVDNAITQMGHSPTSSTAGRVLSSMFIFGLLSSRGTKNNKFVSITKLALEILLENNGDPHYYELLKQAATHESAMQEVMEKWGTNIPAEETIKKVLQLEMEYSSEGAKRFASVIVETYDFARLSKIEMAKEEEDPNKSKGKPDDKGGIVGSTRKANLLLRGQNREIIISAPSDLTDEEFNLVLKWLEFQKYGLVNPTQNESPDGN